MPVCTFRADDGIRTRDPHLGKVMRYQLRHIRELWARSSSTAFNDNSARTRSGTNPRVRAPDLLYSAEMSLRANLRPRQDATVRCARRSRGSVGERPLHTRKVAGSIPAGTTQVGQAAMKQLTFERAGGFNHWSGSAIPSSRSNIRADAASERGEGRGPRGDEPTCLRVAIPVSVMPMAYGSNRVAPLSCSCVRDAGDL